VGREDYLKKVEFRISPSPRLQRPLPSRERESLSLEGRDPGGERWAISPERGDARVTIRVINWIPVCTGMTSVLF